MIPSKDDPVKRDLDDVYQKRSKIHDRIQEA